MGDPDWRPGLLGLVANSLAEEYERPVFLWGREGGVTLKGSCRAGRKGISVVALIEAAEDTFVSGGGHAASGGFTLRDDAVFDFETRMAKALASLNMDDADVAVMRADQEIPVKEATSAFLKRLERLAPFGMGNPKPVFLFRDATIANVSWFGKSGEHLKLTIMRDEFESMDAIAFYARRDFGKNCETLIPGIKAHLLASLERDQFSRGQPVRLRLSGVSAELR
jgi:single-stranded-DNA-specific exonuclease